MELKLAHMNLAKVSVGQTCLHIILITPTIHALCLLPQILHVQPAAVCKPVEAAHMLRVLFCCSSLPLPGLVPMCVPPSFAHTPLRTGGLLLSARWQTCRATWGGRGHRPYHSRGGQVCDSAGTTGYGVFAGLGVVCMVACGITTSCPACRVLVGGTATCLRPPSMPSPTPFSEPFTPSSSPPLRHSL